MGVSVLLQDQADRTAARREYVWTERWLLTGATGQLGRHLIALIGTNPDRPAVCLATSRHGGTVSGLSVYALDLRDADELDRLLADYRPTHVVHLASLSQPTQAHADPQGFHDLTVQATWRLARHVRAVGGWMFYPSSDFVLCGDGPGLRDEGAAVCGDSVYARGKLAGERVVLEAARAGDAGKGFAVVAVEVRRLAQSAANASSEVKLLIEQSASEVRGGSALVGDAAGKIEAVLDASRSSSELMRGIATDSREQAGAIDQVSIAVRTMDEMTQHNAALVEEINAAIEQTESQATALDLIVDVFAVADERAATRRAPLQAARPASAAVRKPMPMSHGNAALDSDWTAF